MQADVMSVRLERYKEELTDEKQLTNQLKDYISKLQEQLKEQKQFMDDHSLKEQLETLMKIYQNNCQLILKVKKESYGNDEKKASEADDDTLQKVKPYLKVFCLAVIFVCEQVPKPKKSNWCRLICCGKSHDEERFDKANNIRSLVEQIFASTFTTIEELQGMIDNAGHSGKMTDSLFHMGIMDPFPQKFRTRTATRSSLLMLGMENR